ncbi:NAD(P)/FAD-dependent oxidoreductase [Sphingorhabdus sp. EL138]|uniref:flavin-containing monooxygenase n=1 Tax=Sphingorhabdus sp. EL138 TaxID=2073156 RepID=UPI000D68DB33|nr:NAD(P)/FAD-dependent oxidoreductase [Sphingorhabdus sp. EL138]
MKKIRVGVIGAGPAGLATARALRDEGHDVCVFERNDKVGGIWDIDAFGTPMYNSAHFISSKGRWTSHFAGHPFADDTPEYPSHAQVHSYLKTFAETEGLISLTRFNCRVDRCTQIEGGGWRVEGTDFDEDFDAIVVCSGTLWEAVMPKIEGKFSGSIRHSQTYKDPEEFRDKNVLIIGAGNSGVDIACDAARVANSAYLSVRRGYWFLPKFVMGRPIDAFFADGAEMPEWISPPDFSAFVAMVAGNPKQFGLPEPDHAPLASHPIMNNEILQHMGHGRIKARGDVVKFEGKNVQFESGEIDQVDEIICATGYRAGVDFLPDGLLDFQGGTRPDLKMCAFHPSAENIYFNGMIETNGGVFGLFDRFAKSLASLINKKANGTLSSDNYTKLILEADAKAKTTGKINSSRHFGYVDTANFLSALDYLDSQLHLPN